MDGRVNPMELIVSDLRMYRKYGHLRNDLENLPTEVSRDELIRLGVEPQDVDRMAEAFVFDLID